MRTPSSLAIVLGLLAVAGCAGPTAGIVRTPSHPEARRQGASVIGAPLDRRRLAALVVTYINLYRSKHNLSLPRPDSIATVAADWMADYQAGHRTVTHVTEQEGWRKFGERYRRLGGGAYTAGYENASWSPLFDPAAGSNLTYDQMARAIVDGWINSPKHHQNLIAQMEGTDPYIGVGVAVGDNAGYAGIYATMDIFMFAPAARIR